jgi:thioesterase domain-containing protein
VSPVYTVPVMLIVWRIRLLMTGPLSPIIVLPGAGGEAPVPQLFRAGCDDMTRVEAMRYPGWPRYIEDGFTADVLIEDLVAQIVTKVPLGPVRIVGLSIGGHFGYAIALRLEAMGREIAGFCAIDATIIPRRRRWGGHALADGWNLLRQGRIGEFFRFSRSLFWRLLFRSAQRRLPSLLRNSASSGRLPSSFALDPAFEKELSMGLLMRKIGPWVASLDGQPVVLKAPTALLRSAGNASNDAAWRLRCPGIKIIEIPGQHETFFDSENVNALHKSFIAATGDWR